LANSTRTGTRGRKPSRAGSRQGSTRGTKSAGGNQSAPLAAKARAKPFATAAAIGGVVAAGVFLWTRRTQISDKVEDLSDQITEATENLRVGSDAAQETSSAESSAAPSTPRLRSRRTQAEIAQEALTLKQIGEPA
jgi:hypothetical protein